MSEPTLVIPGVTDPSTLACIARSRTYTQYCLMVENALAKRCPFCEIDESVNKLLINANQWRAWQSPAPEKHTKHHFIIVPWLHKTSTAELGHSDRFWLFETMNQLREMHGYTGYGILIRDGDARLSAGTIEHLHVHVMVPDGTGRVESPFYKGAEAELEGLRRAIVFEKRRQGIPMAALSDEEKVLVAGRI